MARDYTWLVGAVKDWTRRSDIAAKMPDLVMLAEERISADLDARGGDSLTVIPTVAGAQTVSLPTEVISIRSIGMPDAGGLDYISPDGFNDLYRGSTSGRPRKYTVIGDVLYLGPTPDAVYQLQVSARKTLSPLSDSSLTNWLILRNPSLYLAATMLEALDYLCDFERRPTWEGKYQIALNTANATKDTPGDLVVRTDTKTP
jgi:hypothetical protein